MGRDSVAENPFDIRNLWILNPPLAKSFGGHCFGKDSIIGGLL